MDYRKDLLLASAARLYSMGVDLEAALAKLKELVEQGVGYTYFIATNYQLHTRF